MGVYWDFIGFYWDYIGLGFYCLKLEGLGFRGALGFGATEGVGFRKC